MAESEHQFDNPKEMLAEAESNRMEMRLYNHLGRFVAPIGWQPRISAQATSLKCKTGTCALVDTGEIKALVTCEHVWTAWKKYKQKYPGAELLVGLDDGIPLVLSNAEPVSIDKDLDLAVIGVTVRHDQLQTKAFFRIEEWPIPLPNAGDFVTIVGFPGTGRSPIRERTTFWTKSVLGLQISSVSPRQITLAPERNDRTFYDENGEKAPHRNIGGMSGSPAFLLKSDGPPRLAGFVKEGKTSDSFIFLTPARYLQSNGNLRGW